MLIKIKNLRRQLYTVEIDPEKLIIDLKTAFFTKCNSNYAIENQQLIYAGLILDDIRTIASYGVDEKKYIIIIKKPKELKFIKNNSVNKKTNSSASKRTAKKKEKQVNMDKGLKSMGKVNTSKITDNQLAMNKLDAIELLRKQPEFLQLRSIIRKNPEQMFSALQLIGRANPGLLNMLAKNQETFLNFLYEEDKSNNSDLVNCTSSNLNCDTNTDSLEDDINSDRAIVISEEDQAAIDRLIDLGFPEHLVVQAYIVCDRNEVLAANFLLFDFGV